MCCLSKQAGEQEPEPHFSDTPGQDDIKNWIQKLSSVVMTLWSHDAVSMDVARTAGIPVFTYGECLLKSSPENVLMLQPLPMMVHLNLEVEDG